MVSDLIPRPEAIRDRLDAIARERSDLRRLLKLSERHHGEPEDGRAKTTEPLKLETKAGG